MIIELVSQREEYCYIFCNTLMADATFKKMYDDPTTRIDSRRPLCHWRISPRSTKILRTSQKISKLALKRMSVLTTSTPALVIFSWLRTVKMPFEGLYQLTPPDSRSDLCRCSLDGQLGHREMIVVYRTKYQAPKYRHPAPTSPKLGLCTSKTTTESFLRTISLLLFPPTNTTMTMACPG